MILRLLFVLVLSPAFMATAGLLDPVFTALGVSRGLRSPFIALCLLLATALMAKTRHMEAMVRDLAVTGTMWGAWLVYLAIRCDFDDPYSRLIFAKIVVLQFVGVCALTIVYMSDPRSFDRVFPIGVVLLGLALLLQAWLDPQVFVYATFIERMTVQDANPIWLARSYGFAAVCLMFITRVPLILRIAGSIGFLAAMVPTGSRAPLLAVGICVLIFACRMLRGRGVLPAVAAVLAAVPVVYIIFGDEVARGVGAYLSRGTGMSSLEESGRPMLFMRAIGEFISAPMFGVGLGQFGRASTNVGSNLLQGGYPHNLVLEILSGLGLVGFALFVGVLRLGRWILAPRTVYDYLFILAFIYAMSSGDLSGNNGVFLFAALARLGRMTEGRSRQKVATGRATLMDGDASADMPGGSTVVRRVAPHS